MVENLILPCDSNEEIIPPLHNTTAVPPELVVWVLVQAYALFNFVYNSLYTADNLFSSNVKFSPKTTGLCFSLIIFPICL